MTLKDKVVLVTGSAQGIGAEIAQKLSSLGANIALNDILAQEQNLRNLTTEIEGKGVKAKYFIADISKLKEVERMIKEVQKFYGRLDILINNAAITKDRTLAKMTPEEWQKVIDVDLTGVFNCTKTSLPLITQAKGKIINISSVVGQRGNFGQTNYAAAKAGIIGFSKALAKEVGRFGVTVNVIAPGFIASPLTQSLPEELKMTVKKLTALGRFGQPQEVANLVSFLASEESGFITGAVINIDGGLTI